MYLPVDFLLDPLKTIAHLPNPSLPLLPSVNYNLASNPPSPPRPPLPPPRPPNPPPPPPLPGSAGNYPCYSCCSTANCVVNTCACGANSYGIYTTTCGYHTNIYSGQTNAAYGTAKSCTINAPGTTSCPSGSFCHNGNGCSFNAYTCPVPVSCNCNDGAFCCFKSAY